MIKETIVKKKHLMLCIACVSGLVALCGCGRQEQAEVEEVTEVEKDIGDTGKVETEIKNMEEWEGTWCSFTEYCNDEKMQDAWGDIADSFGVEEEQLKSIFDSLCFITDDVVKFEITDGVVTAYDTEDKVVFSGKYHIVGVFEGDSDQTVFEGKKSYLFETADEGAGNFKYLCLMPRCPQKHTHDGLELANHFHFNYGSTIEKATNRSGFPSMLDDGITEKEKLQTLYGFFLGSEN